MKTRVATRFGLAASIGLFLSGETFSAAPILAGVAGGLEVWSVPDENPPPGLLGTTLVLRTQDPAGRIVTFENIAIRGDVHQVTFPKFNGEHDPASTPNIGEFTLPDDAEIVAADTHILFTDFFARTEGAGFQSLMEDNDLSDPAGLGDFGRGALVGIGDLAMWAPTDAFWLDIGYQHNETEFAHIVKPDRDSEIFLTVGVLGERMINSGEPGGARWGFGDDNPPLAIPFVPEPTGGAMLIITLAICSVFRKRS